MTVEQAASLAATSNWSHVDRQKVHQDWDALYKQLAQMVDLEAPDAPAVQALITQHYEIASRFYDASDHAYVGMALCYQENSDMSAFHNAYHPRMTEFLGDAIYAFVQAR